MRKKDATQNISGLLKSAGLGAGLGLLSTMLLLLVFAALMATGKITEELRDTMVLTAVIAGAALGGLYCAGRQGRGVVTAGLAESVFYVVIVLLCSMIWMKNSGETSLTMKIIVASFVGGVFGGVLKLYRRTKKSRVRK